MLRRVRAAAYGVTAEELVAEIAADPGVHAASMEYLPVALRRRVAVLIDQARDLSRRHQRPVAQADAADDAGALEPEEVRPADPGRLDRLGNGQ
ncbi:hypothetical protein PXH69_31430 [Rhodococcus qingshengii]|uniref:Uncharacterized protein n=1 Tax=Rhodococcus qingshengii TaxID=334542 RepID=A0AAW6LQZ7_RHOSG|nr:hypothetical protein [Rhodococcus qingshengii]MDE8649489.1 hypothetical protein [Rhodococcus qingshengii]